MNCLSFYILIVSAEKNVIITHVAYWKLKGKTGER